MIEEKDVEKIKEIIAEFFLKTDTDILGVDIVLSSIEKETEDIFSNDKKLIDFVEANIRIKDPQIFIGERGQTLLEMQKLLRVILNKKFENRFCLNLDINDYKKKKVEYLKNMAREIADEVSSLKREKRTFPLSSYERMVFHSELANRKDVKTESRGEDPDRCVVVFPR
jgi:spoIIIJ-associated protein